MRVESFPVARSYRHADAGAMSLPEQEGRIHHVSLAASQRLRAQVNVQPEARLGHVLANRLMHSLPGIGDVTALSLSDVATRQQTAIRLLDNPFIGLTECSGCAV
jgi:hypothetical protein